MNQKPRFTHVFLMTKARWSKELPEVGSVVGCRSEAISKSALTKRTNQW